MKVLAHELLQRLPGPSSAKWPDGERFVQAMAHGSMSVELYSPTGHDPQTPHAQDELYFIHAGTGELIIDDVRHRFEPGAAFLCRPERSTASRTSAPTLPPGWYFGVRRAVRFEVGTSLGCSPS